MTLREKLIVLRDKAGISQMSLAHQLDVSRQAVSRWESGDTTPSMDKLKALAKIYSVQEQFAQLLAQEKITQEDIDTFYALVDHAQKPDYPTEPIEKIIQEEMAAYIDGAIDEKTTAERIQSRVSLYLMEQKVE